MNVARSLRRAVAAGAAAALAGAVVVSTLPATAGAEDEFINGSGRADAKLLRMGPSAGRLSLAPTIGLSLSDYLGTLGRGESRVADFAALDGSVPPEFSSRMPSVRAESTEEGAGTPKATTIAGTPAGSPITVGAAEQKAYADKDPEGSSSFALGVYGVPGFFEISGGIAESRAAVVGGKTREAIGTTRIGSVKLGGGAVTLNGLKWEALQRTGDGASTAANFTVEGVTLGGPLGSQKLPVPDGGANLEAVLKQINTALAPTGLVLDPPSKDTSNNVARVGPLAIRVVDSTVGQAVLGPVLGGLQPIRDPATGALINANPEFSTAVLLADVAVGVFSGSGRNDIELGGASAYTEGERFDSPFGAFQLGEFSMGESGGGEFELGSADDGAFAGDAATSPDTFSSASGALPTASLGTTTNAAPPAAGSGGGPGRQTAVPLAASRTIPGKRGGAAVAVGLVGLLGALAMAAADYRRLRTSRRTITVP